MKKLNGILTISMILLALGLYAQESLDGTVAGDPLLEGGETSSLGELAKPELIDSAKNSEAKAEKQAKATDVKAASSAPESKLDLSWSLGGEWAWADSLPGAGTVYGRQGMDPEFSFDAKARERIKRSKRLEIGALGGIELDGSLKLAPSKWEGYSSGEVLPDEARDYAFFTESLNARAYGGYGLLSGDKKKGLWDLSLSATLGIWGNDVDPDIILEAGLDPSEYFSTMGMGFRPFIGFEKESADGKLRFSASQDFWGFFLFDRPGGQAFFWEESIGAKVRIKPSTAWDMGISARSRHRASFLPNWSLDALLDMSFNRENFALKLDCLAFDYSVDLPGWAQAAACGQKARWGQGIEGRWKSKNGFVGLGLDWSLWGLTRASENQDSDRPLILTAEMGFKQ